MLNFIVRWCIVQGNLTWNSEVLEIKYLKYLYWIYYNTLVKFHFHEQMGSYFLINNLENTNFVSETTLG